MDVGQKVKLPFAGGHIGVVTAKKFECSYCIDGKPSAGIFFEVELEATDESPTPVAMGFKSKAND